MTSVPFPSVVVSTAVYQGKVHKENDNIRSIWALTSSGLWAEEEMIYLFFTFIFLKHKFHGPTQIAWQREDRRRRERIVEKSLKRNKVEIFRKQGLWKSIVYAYISCELRPSKLKEQILHHLLWRANLKTAFATSVYLMGGIFKLHLKIFYLPISVSVYHFYCCFLYLPFVCILNCLYVLCLSPLFHSYITHKANEIAVLLHECTTVHTAHHAP